MKKFLIILIAVSAISSLFYFFASHRLFLTPKISESKFVTLKINGAAIGAEIADTSEKRKKGLSDRESLFENQGMLFVFDRPDRYQFWMKDMKFSLDFIWISGDKVVEIAKNVKPEDYMFPSSFSSESHADKVLELNSGEADRFGIKEGDAVSLVK